MEIKPLGQRWKEWASIPLGTSTTTTIGSHGCTITCLTMLLNYFGYNETPATVNEKLKKNKGYANTNLLDWQAIPRIWTRMKFEWRGYGYDNNQVSNNLPCLVEVDFDNLISSPNDRHWVLFKGNKRMNDPWTGLDEPTSKYSILKGYSVITGTHPTTEENNQNNDGANMADMYKGIDLNNKESVKVAVDLWADVVQNGKVIISKEEYQLLLNDRTRKGELDQEVSALKEQAKDFNADCAKKVAAKETEIRTELAQTISDLENDLAEANGLVEPLNTELARVNNKIIELGNNLAKAEGQIDMIKRVAYQAFNIPVITWDKEETILSHLTSLTSGGNVENLSITKLLGVIFIKFGKLLSQGSLVGAIKSVDKESNE